MTTTQARSAPTITVEADPTPFVLRLAHRVRLATATEGGRALLHRLGANQVTAAVQVAGSPRKATVVCTPDAVRITHGIPQRRDVLVTLADDPASPVVEHDPATTAGTLLADVIGLLNPLVPSWQDSATRFWELAGSDTAMPGSVRITVTDGDTHTLGESTPVFEIHGQPDVLARTFAGLDPFFDHVLTGGLSVRGTMAQLSVMTGAFWKVQTHA